MLSIVIPTRDKASRLRLTLAGLLRQTPDGPAFEVIVVDDGSCDGTVAVVAECAGTPPPRLVRREGVGRAAARNAGADAAKGDVLVFLDDDILVPPEFVAAHAAVHTDPAGALGLAGPEGGPPLAHGPLRELPGASRLVAEAPADPYAAAIDGLYGRTVVNSLERMVEAMAVGRAPCVAPWLACIGANVSMPRALWRAVGGFDEGFGQRWGCEDLELGYRLHAAGARLLVAPAASGIHLSHARPGRWDEHGETFQRFLAHHPDPAVDALPVLLSPDGGPARYLSALQVERNRHAPTPGANCVPTLRETEGARR